MPPFLKIAVLHVRKLGRCVDSSAGLCTSEAKSKEHIAHSNLEYGLSEPADAGMNTSEAKGKAQKKNQQQEADPNIYSIQKMPQRNIPAKYPGKPTAHFSSNSRFKCRERLPLLHHVNESYLQLIY